VLDQLVLLAGSHFYTSATFWGPAAGVIVALIGILVTVWVTLRAANPNRRLYYSMTADTPLITGRHELSQQLKVIYGTKELGSPRIVNVQITSRGRRDITREAFDDKPLCLDLGSSIVECVKAATSPSDRPEPAYTMDGSKLLIGPSPFGTHQTTVFSLLIDGPIPQIVAPKQSLIDVKVRLGVPPSSVIQLVIFWIACAAAIGSLVSLAFSFRATAWLLALVLVPLLGLTVLFFVYQQMRKTTDRS
jgi:hypothetical protein